MRDEQYDLRRYIAEYSEETQELTGEYDLSDFDLTKFQAEFNEPNLDDPMVDCYPITADNVAFLKPYLATEPDWNFAENSYFVEAHL